MCHDSLNAIINDAVNVLYVKLCLHLGLYTLNGCPDVELLYEGVQTFLGLSVSIAECFIIWHLAEIFLTSCNVPESTARICYQLQAPHAHLFGISEGTISHSVGGTVNWPNFSKEYFGDMHQMLSKGLCPLSQDFEKSIQYCIIYICEKLETTSMFNSRRIVK